MKFQVLMVAYNLDNNEAFHDAFKVDLKEGDYAKGGMISDFYDQEWHVEKMIRERMPDWKHWVMEFTIWLDGYGIDMFKYNACYHYADDQAPLRREGFIELLLKEGEA